MRYEYKVIPAPERGERSKGANGAEARFAATIERIMNDMAARGWEYQRTDTLPSSERAGLTQTATVWRNLLVFRRPHAEDVSVFAPRMLEPPAPPQTRTPVNTPVPTPVHAVAQAAKAAPDPTTKYADVAADAPARNGTKRPSPVVEDTDDDNAPITALPGPLASRAAQLRSRRSQA